MKGIFTILNYYFSPGRRAAQWPLATAPAAVGDRNLHPDLFFVKYFSLKKASEFPFFSKGFSLLSAGIMHPAHEGMLHSVAFPLEDQ